MYFREDKEAAKKSESSKSYDYKKLTQYWPKLSFLYRNYIDFLCIFLIKKKYMYYQNKLRKDQG